MPQERTRITKLWGRTYVEAEITSGLSNVSADLLLVKLSDQSQEKDPTDLSQL